MKKITIIDCFISSDKVLEKLETMISQLKNNGEDVFLLSNTNIPPHIQELTNYSFYDKNNRLFTDDYEGVSLLDIWKGFDKGGIHELEPAFQRHGLSVIINLFFILGLCGSVANLLLTQSYRLAEASLVTPIKYLSLVFAIIFGFLIWNEFPKVLTLLGAGLVIISSLIIFIRENKLKKQIVTPRT